jgi:hypothetical protein
VNYCQSIVNKLNSLLWGQYENKSDNHLITWRVPVVKQDWGSGTWEPRAQRILDILNHVMWEANPGNRVLFNWGLDAGIYGTGIISPRYDPVAQEILLDPVPAKSFHCIWNSDGAISEAIVVEFISQTEAAERHGWKPTAMGNVNKIWAGVDINLVERVQHWTPWEYSIYLDGKPVSSSYNPYCWVDETGQMRAGIMPFIILANKPAAGDLYGYSDMDPVQDVMYELNHVMAMMGDVVSENANPIKVLINQRGDDDKWKLGADRTWRIFGNDADAKLLSYEGGIPNAHQYVTDLLTVMEDTGCVPAIAYGRFKGTQGSSLMLQVEMMPALQVANWKRLIAANALTDLGKMILSMLTAPTSYGQRLIQGEPLGMDRNAALRHQIIPIFAPMLPKDDVANTNKQISLVSNRLRSRRRALEELDEQDIDAEMERIEQDEADEQKLAAKQNTVTGQGSQMQPAEESMLAENQKEAKGEYQSGNSK